MSRSARVEKLRAQSLEAKPWISTERAELLTTFHKKHRQALPAPIQRALAFKYILGHKTIRINEGELIVGERGEAPKATPTYPEICCHSVEDLEVLNSRPKTSFATSEEARRVYAADIIPFWQGKTIREMIFRDMTQGWKDAYEAGVFTEFMEQRAPGHTVLDDKIYRKGFLDFEQDIDESLAGLDELNDRDAWSKRQELEAMRICIHALIRYAERHAEKIRQLAQETDDDVRRGELLEAADICDWVPAHAPRTFHEALQYYWFVHVGVITELNTWDSFNPGRLDQHLLPFYRKGLADGTLTEEKARELLQCFWVKFNNQPAPPKVGVTAAESGTYTDFALINTGGVTPDGRDGVNELTYIILDVIEEMRLLQPSSCLQVSKKNPDQFLRRAGKIIKTGFGQPSIFNCDVIAQELVRQGKRIEDARCGGSSGCVEVGAFGKENYCLTGYMNLPKIFEISLNRGVDARTGRRIGIDCGDPTDCTSFGELIDAFRRQLRHFVDIKIRGNNVIERLYAMYMPTPFLSLLIDDCIARGKDYHDGGARYDSSYIQGVGLGSLTDIFAAIKHHVFDAGVVPLSELLAALRDDFEGREPLRQRLWNKSPKYGNDDDYADDLMRSIFEVYFEAIDGRPNTRGGNYHINLLPTTVHIYFGSVTGATADGRRAGQPLSDGVSPVQGADRLGPTAVLKSVGKMDHVRTGGTLLNQKLAPELLETEEGLTNFVHLVRSYFLMDGHHIQFNVVTAETLRAAQREPEKHRDLIVRVAGYSDYFCDLSEALQQEIITRTEHKAF
ncbi:MAG: glycyl radical protein [Phycisphaerales bacterium]|nr:glycyl radical protein [Phycisphaerales bacterium]